MIRFRTLISLGVLLSVVLVTERTQAFRQVPLTPSRAALAAAVEGHYRAVRGRTGLIYYARRRGFPRAMTASIRAGETYRVTFVNRDQQLGALRRFGYRLSIDGRRSRFAPASVRGDIRAFHTTALRVGRHRVRLSVIDLATRRRRLAYNGQVLVTGGGPIYLFLSRCGPQGQCRVALRQSGRTLYRRP